MRAVTAVPSDAAPVTRGDEALLLAYQQGEAAAFAELFERYRGRAHGYALRMLRRPELAEEACTDAFCRLLEGRWQPGGSVRSFLFTVLHRRCLELLRRRSTHDRLSHKLAPEPVQPEVDDALQLAGDQARLRAAMDELKPEHRAVLLLYYAQELPSREVAVVLACSDQQVRSRLSYARRKLRQLLEEDR